MPSVLITGITGFLGSHIAECLLNNGVEVLGLKRKTSDIWRCNEFKDKIYWIDIEDDGSYPEKLISLTCDTIIHCAWIGVEASDRDDWNEQINNVKYLLNLLNVAKILAVQKIIVLGSQAEYGVINGIVSEDNVTNALTAYGGVKLACLQILKTFCNTNNIDWIWLRVFSIFGEKENSNWLIPSLIKSMSNGDQMDFSLGEQKYAYLYIKDFSKILHNVIISQIESGVYNVSSTELISIKKLIETVRDNVRPEFKLNFGALNYRHNQSMMMAGNVSKLFSKIGKQDFTDFNVALQNTVDYYLKNLKLL